MTHSDPLNQTTVTLPKPDEHIGTGLRFHETMHEVTLRYRSADDAIAALQILEGLTYD